MAAPSPIAVPLTRPLAENLLLKGWRLRSASSAYRPDQAAVRPALPVGYPDRLRYDEKSRGGVKRNRGSFWSGRAWRAVTRVARRAGGREDARMDELVQLLLLCVVVIRGEARVLPGGDVAMTLSYISNVTRVDLLPGMGDGAGVKESRLIRRSFHACRGHIHERETGDVMMCRVKSAKGTAWEDDIEAGTQQTERVSEQDGPQGKEKHIGLQQQRTTLENLHPQSCRCATTDLLWDGAAGAVGVSPCAAAMMGAIGVWCRCRRHWRGCTNSFGVKQSLTGGAGMCKRCRMCCCSCGGR